MNGQSMVEFALVLPVVLTLVFGVIEFGFLLWSYSSVNSAAREASRYGIAIGAGSTGDARYYDCDGIRDAALRAGTFAGMEAADIFIHYDNGMLPDENAASPNPAYSRKYDTCEDLAADAADGSDDIVFGDRIVISVTHDYQPIVSLIGINIQPFNMIARSNRTIIKSAEVVRAGNGGGGGGGGSIVCFTVATAHTGEGLDPTVSPASSSGCNLSEYLGGATLTFTANPATGWSVGGWVGTDNDASTSTTNTVSMPGDHHTVTVNYVNTTPNCYTLSLSANGTGTGAGPTALPANSTGCSAGRYVSGEVIRLDVTPNAGSEIAGWSGTNDDSSFFSPNWVTMPSSNHSASVTIDLISPICYTLAVSHTGSGADPSASAPNCAGGKYVENTVVNLNATASAGYAISGWTNTNNDSSTSNTNSVTMTGNKVVSVDYVVSNAPPPPVSVDIPHDDDDWKWHNGHKKCTLIDLEWASNSSWSPSSPIYYEVFRGSTSWGAIMDTHWDSDFTINVGEQITLGVRAVFSGGIVSATSEVTYACFVNDLVFWGSVIK